MVDCVLLIRLEKLVNFPHFISLILTTIRSRNNIASSGIVETILGSCQIAHSALILPLNMQIAKTPTLNINKNSGIETKLKSCQLIIWDKCTMANKKKTIEALYCTITDLRKYEQFFGGELILLLNSLNSPNNNAFNAH